MRHLFMIYILHQEWEGGGGGKKSIGTSTSSQISFQRNFLATETCHKLEDTAGNKFFPFWWSNPSDENLLFIFSLEAMAN